MGKREENQKRKLAAAGVDPADAFFFPTKDDVKKANKLIAWLKTHELKPSGILTMVRDRVAVPEFFLDIVRAADFDDRRNDHDGDRPTL